LKQKGQVSGCQSQK